MHAYRAYLVGPDGHIVNRVDLFVGNDASAKERARGLVDSGPIELWDGDRKIAEFKPMPTRDLADGANDVSFGRSGKLPLPRR